METVSEMISKAAIKGGIENVPDVLLRIRNAFDLFDSQSALLQNSFEHLKQNLALANRQLNDKNHELSEKVGELQQMSVRLHCILESLADGVLVVNGSMIVERCNPAAENLLGLDRSEIEGRSYASIMNGLGNIHRLRSAIEEGQTVLDEQRTCNHQGSRRVVVLASVAPIRGAGGAILGAVEVLRDVSQLRLLEERMHHQKRMAALGEMATSVAHEIRNPLGTIEGFARLLRSDLDKQKQADHSRLASKIIEGTQNLNYVITNLLTYARPMTLQCERFDVANLFSSVLDILAAMAAQHGVQLNIQMPAAPLAVYGDIRHLRQVLVNLGRNAIEACAKGGLVALQAEVRRREAVFLVSDNGCGISKEDLPSIFDPFFTRKEGGTGLGLSLCHKIVAAHGGEITVNSTVGSGTTIKVILPQIGGDK